MDPTAFESICTRVAGAENLYNCINNAICSNRMSTERKQLSKLRTMVIIYIMVYSQSQRSNSFQVALLRTLQQFGITEQGLQSLRNLGIAAHPHTVKAKAKLSSSAHSNHVVSFIESAVEISSWFSVSTTTTISTPCIGLSPRHKQMQYICPLCF